MSYFERLKAKWGISSNLSVILILVVFSLAGMSVLHVGRFFLGFVGVDEGTPFALKFLAWLFFIFPAYQVLLLMYGLLFFQFNFFWQKEKKMVAWVLRLLRLARAPETREDS